MPTGSEYAASGNLTQGGGDWYKDTLENLEEMDYVTEDDVQSTLIRGVLSDVLSFGIQEISQNSQAPTGKKGAKRPDFVCKQRNGPHASVIVEVKNLGKDLMPTGGGSFLQSPAGQLSTYLNGDPRSTDGTWGILTNGTEWIVVQRKGDRVPARAFYREGIRRSARTLAEIHEALEEVVDAPSPSTGPGSELEEARWLEFLSDTESPTTFIESCIYKEYLSPPPPPMKLRNGKMKTKKCVRHL